MARSRTVPAKAGVFITGESPLVEEYAKECLRAGLSTTVRLNAGRATERLEGVHRSARVVSGCSLGIELTNTSLEVKRKNLRDLAVGLAPHRPILSSASTASVAEQSSWITTQARLLGIAALPGLLQGGLMELAPASGAQGGAVDEALKFVSLLGKESAIVQDSPGMVMPRILCMLVNEAYFALGEHAAERDDIDTAMRLGTNYPRGPVEWGDRIGLEQVCAVLAGLRRYFGEERYKAAPLLTRLAGTAVLDF